MSDNKIKKRHVTREDKFRNFPRSVDMLPVGEYYGQIQNICLDEEKNQIVVTVRFWIDDDTEITRKKMYDNVSQVMENSPLWYLVSGLGLIGKGGKILWEKLLDVEEVIVEIAHSEYGAYVRNIKVCEESEEDDSAYYDGEEDDFEDDTDYDDV